MFNPIETIQRFKSRLGKPVRPIIELQKDGSVVNIVTNTIQTENVIHDTYKMESWEVHPEDRASAVYIDGVFKGMGFFAGEEGQVLRIKKDVELYEPVLDKDGKPTYNENHEPLLRRVINLAYKGIFGKLIDASIFERGSALKMSVTEKIVLVAVAFMFGFMFGMSYVNR